MVTTLTHTIGMDRARQTVSSHATALPLAGNWRGVSVAPCGSTGLSAATGMYTTNPAGAFEQTIKRPTRPLGTRST